MYHSITFYTGTIKLNTYDDWHLVPETRPLVTPPTQKTKYLDIPGANGNIDLSDSLTGYPVFNNREGEWSFYVLNGFGEWQNRFSSIMMAIQGKRLKVVLEDDPNYYYEGRFRVSSWSSEQNWSKIKINYTVAPYKVACQETTGPNNTVYLVDTGGTSL